jgi:hypothetical protein
MERSDGGVHDRGAREVAGGSPPPWVSIAARQTWSELREFFATALAFSRHPARFADAWYRGEREALNPFGMLATAAAIVASVHQVVPLLVLALFPKARREDDGGDSLVHQVLAAVGPFLHYALLGALAHAVLRLAGSRRLLRGSIGVALFAGAGPGSGGYLLIYLVAVVVTMSGSKFFEGPYAVFAIASGFFLFVWALCVGLAGLHGVKVWRSTVAVAIAIGIAGVLFGLLPQMPEVFGLHFRVEVLSRPIEFRFTDA